MIIHWVLLCIISYVFGTYIEPNWGFQQSENGEYNLIATYGSLPTFRTATRVVFGFEQNILQNHLNPGDQQTIPYKIIPYTNNQGNRTAHFIQQISPDGDAKDCLKTVEGIKNASENVMFLGPTLSSLIKEPHKKCININVIRKENKVVIESALLYHQREKVYEAELYIQKFSKKDLLLMAEQHDIALVFKDEKKEWIENNLHSNVSVICIMYDNIHGKTVRHIQVQSHILLKKQHGDLLTMILSINIPKHEDRISSEQDISEVGSGQAHIWIKIDLNLSTGYFNYDVDVLAGSFAVDPMKKGNFVVLNKYSEVIIDRYSVSLLHVECSEYDKENFICIESRYGIIVGINILNRNIECDDTECVVTLSTHLVENSTGSIFTKFVRNIYVLETNMFSKPFSCAEKTVVDDGDTSENFGVQHWQMKYPIPKFAVSHTAIIRICYKFCINQFMGNGFCFDAPGEGRCSDALLHLSFPTLYDNSIVKYTDEYRAVTPSSVYMAKNVHKADFSESSSIGIISIIIMLVLVVMIIMFLVIYLPTYYSPSTSSSTSTDDENSSRNNSQVRVSQYNNNSRQSDKYSSFGFMNNVNHMHGHRRTEMGGRNNSLKSSFPMYMAADQ